MASLDTLQLWAAASEREAVVNHRGHRMRVPLGFGPMFELAGLGAEHTFSAVLSRAATPERLMLAGGPVMLLDLTAIGVDRSEQRLRLIGLADIGEQADDRKQRLLARLDTNGDGYRSYSVVSEGELPAGTEIRVRMRDISHAGDRRWRLQRRWPFVGRPKLFSQVVMTCLIG